LRSKFCCYTCLMGAGALRFEALNMLVIGFVPATC
jgi:hypothetical protein